jgi:endonuclease III
VRSTVVNIICGHLLTMKNRYIKEAAQILLRDYDGDIPPTFEDMKKLPGVGPKVALVCISHAWGRADGIGVDVHVHRISNRLGWVATTTPEGTRKVIKKIFCVFFL